MKIKIKREGGFIGITSKADLEYDQLTVAEQNALNSLAEKSVQSVKKNKEQPLPQTEVPSPAPTDVKPVDKNAVTTPQGRALEVVEPLINDNGIEFVENQMPHHNNSSMMRDGFNYSISMKKDGKTVSMKFDDMTAPPEIVEIFQKYVQY